jgi:hypothetical protein
MDPSQLQNSVNNALPVKPVEKSIDDYSIHELLELIRLERTKNLNESHEKELKELTKRQAQVRFLANLKRIVTLANQDNGGFNANIEELQKLIAKANESENEELKTLLQDAGIVEGKESYTKEEKTNILDSIRLSIEQLNVLNDMQMQVVTRLESETNDTIQMCLAGQKPLNNVISAMARAIKGG